MLTKRPGPSHASRWETAQPKASSLASIAERLRPTSTNLKGIGFPSHSRARREMYVRREVASSWNLPTDSDKLSKPMPNRALPPSPAIASWLVGTSPPNSVRAKVCWPTGQESLHRIDTTRIFTHTLNHPEWSGILFF